MRAQVASVIAVLVVSACGTASAAAPAHPPASGGGPRPAATALAGKLLDQVPLPAGTRPAGRKVIPPGSLDPPPLNAADALSVTRLLVVPGQPAALRTYLLAHTPRGTTSSLNQDYSPGPPVALVVTFAVKSPPPGILDASLGFSFVTLSSTTTLVREYAQVTWFGTRSKAEHLDATRYRSVTVTAVIPSVVQPPQRVTRTFANAALTRRLAALLNGLPAAPAGEMPCPGGFDQYSVQFNPVRPSGSVVSVSTFGCFGDQVIVGGAGQPALWDPVYGKSELETIVRQLLGLPASSR